MSAVLKILALMTLTMSVDADNEKCSKEWIRDLIMDACNFSKRDAKILEYIMEHNTGTNRERFFTQISRDVEWTASILGLRLQPLAMKWTTRKPRTLDEYDVSELLQQMAADKGSWLRRARSISHLMRKCCVSLCNIKDFRVLCYVGGLE